MMRLACCLATERGVAVVAPVHDAILVEGAAEEIDEVVAATQAAMLEASEVVLDGFTLRSKAQIVRYPERLLDAKREQSLWDRVIEILDRFSLDYY
jgi:DNA polymerase I